VYNKEVEITTTMGEYMKFNELTKEQWEEWKGYLDTCILPVTGLSGMESPPEVASQLEMLRNWLGGIEIPFRGRTVTYPAYHFIPDNIEMNSLCLVNKLCTQLRSQGFTYIVIISAQWNIMRDELPQADLVVSPVELWTTDLSRAQQQIKERVQKMWGGTRPDQI